MILKSGLNCKVSIATPSSKNSAPIDLTPKVNSTFKGFTESSRFTFTSKVSKYCEKSKPNEVSSPTMVALVIVIAIP